MSDFDVKEKRFEEDIEDYLTHHGGYTKGDPKKFNRESGLDEDTFVEFIKTSQPKKWERYVKIYAENSEKQIIERFKREVKTTNLLNVMRHGFMDRGIKFYPIFWKPETSLNETTQMQYDANILHCTRQLHYSVHNENSIDIVLFANGIPVVSMELKCQFTGQDTTNAINQYKFDRAGKDAIFAFKERVLVHFAVDLTNVYMTTRLEGAHTYFLPFNQGSNGAGKVGGKGNPVNPDGYDTAYLWERVLCKDSLMEILQKYMHLQQEYDKNGNLTEVRYQDGYTITMRYDVMDRLEPFDYGKMVPFEMPYLAGFLAEKYSYDGQQIKKRAEKRAEQYILEDARETMTGYATVSVTSEQVRLRCEQMKYVLLPVWMLNYRYKGKQYLFAMNGQSGRYVADRPLSVGKAVGWWCGITAGLSAVLLALAVLF